MIKEMCCIVCPMSCQLLVDMNEDGSIKSVSGNSCPRGDIYARSEAIDPQRILTTTIRIHDACLPLLPVITSQTVSKAKMFSIMEKCKHIEIHAPIRVNDIIVKNIANSGANLIASRSMHKTS